jgi:hypothetical protein
MRVPWWSGSALLALLVVGSLAGCAKKDMVIDLYGSVVYEKPEILRVSHEMADNRREGGAVVVRVTIVGDPGLTATFDIYPGIVDHHPMTETSEGGHYIGEFSFPPDSLGGAYIATGRLAHADAGDVTLRDPAPLTVPRLLPG